MIKRLFAILTFLIVYWIGIAIGVSSIVFQIFMLGSIFLILVFVIVDAKPVNKKPKVIKEKTKKNKDK